MEIISLLVANFSTIFIIVFVNEQTHGSVQFTVALVVVSRILHTKLLMFYQDSYPPIRVSKTETTWL